MKCGLFQIQADLCNILSCTHALSFSCYPQIYPDSCLYPFSYAFLLLTSASFLSGLPHTLISLRNADRLIIPLSGFSCNIGKRKSKGRCSIKRSTGFQICPVDLSGLKFILSRQPQWHWNVAHSVPSACLAFPPSTLIFPA